jgi:CheY-like chemotaxis protein
VLDSSEVSTGRRLSTPPSSSQPTSAKGRGEALDGAPLILVVDDVDDNRLLYASTLAEEGYRVHEARDGIEALANVAKASPALVVMDLSMPSLDGWETTRRLKADPRTAHIAVVALTGHTTNYGLQQAMEAGACAVLMKPCLPADLSAVIRAILRADH